MICFWYFIRCLNWLAILVFQNKVLPILNIICRKKSVELRMQHACNNVQNIENLALYLSYQINTMGVTSWTWTDCFLLENLTASPVWVQFFLFMLPTFVSLRFCSVFSRPLCCSVCPYFYLFCFMFYLWEALAWPNHFTKMGDLTP